MKTKASIKSSELVDIFQARLGWNKSRVNTQDQHDNCVPEKYSLHPSPFTPHSFYQWDELMSYSETPANQGFCPPAGISQPKMTGTFFLQIILTTLLLPVH